MTDRSDRGTFKVGDKVRLTKSSWAFESAKKEYTLTHFDGDYWWMEKHPKYSTSICQPLHTMELVPFRLEAGKWYKTRGGEIVGPLADRSHHCGEYPFSFPQSLSGSTSKISRANGRWFGDHNKDEHAQDLIEEIPDPTPTKGDVMSSVKPFDFDAFNKVLQASTAICSKGKADIAKAVAAGKGEAEMPVQIGLYKDRHGDVYGMLKSPDEWLLFNFTSLNRQLVAVGTTTSIRTFLVANEFRYYRDVGPAT